MNRHLEIERLVAALASGRLDRREFLKRAAALGLAATPAASLLQACGDRSEASLTPSDPARPVEWSSHPPHRSLPAPSSRPAEERGRAFFLAPHGDDRRGNGSEGRPWQSWRKARTVLKPGDTLYHRGGTYFMHGRCHWNTNGTKESPITLRAYPGELPMITTGHREFAVDPDSGWEPVPASAGGVEHEYRSIATFALVQSTVAGLFTDSYIPLVRYSKLADFRSENEFNLIETDPRSPNLGRSMFNNRADTTIGLWCGPGAYWDSASGKIHIRLRHTNRYWLDHEDYLGIGAGFVTNNYKGQVVPNAMPLLLCGYRNDAAMTKLFASHLRILDIVFAANFRVETQGDRQHYEGCWFYTGDGPGLLHRATNTRFTKCKFRGVGAPWTNRLVDKNRLSSPFTISIKGADNLELDHCEITDAHDAVLFQGEQNCDFHHNLLENSNDDGLFLPTRQDKLKRIYQNIFRMNLSHLPFLGGVGVPETGGNGTYICRNLFEMRPMTAGSHAYDTAPRKPEYYDGYNLRMEHADVIVYPKLYFYHNTVLARGSKRTYCQGITEKYADTVRAVFNNIFVQEDGEPRQNLQRNPSGELQIGHNLQWSRRRGSHGSVAGDVHADPKFVAWNPDWRSPHDFHLRSESPARGAGRDIPADWFDPLRDVDPNRDIGAIPFGVSENIFGPDADV